MNRAMQFLNYITKNTSSEDEAEVATARSSPIVYDYFNDTSSPTCRQPCVFETILSQHIQKQIVEKRTRCDDALLRASSILQQTNKLKENTRTLEQDYSALESHFQRVSNLTGRVTREVERKLVYQDYQKYLGRLIASLMGEYEWGMDGKRITRFYSPCDWIQMQAGPRTGRAMPRSKKRLLKAFLQAKGV